MTFVEDALRDLTRRQLEELQTKIAKELLTCTLCGTEGAEPFRVTRSKHSASNSVTMFFCKPCFEKHRLPESRVKD